MDLLKFNIYINPCVIFIVLFFIYCFIFHLDTFFNKSQVDYIHEFTETCLISCRNKKTCEKVNNYRDKGYYYFNPKSEKCLVTRWEISHLLMHMFLGYYSNIYVSQTLSVGFEIYESKMFDCGSYIDLLYNFLGFYIGFVLRHKKWY